MPFFRPASLSDLLSDLEMGKAEPTMPLREQKSYATAGIALQEPDLDTIYSN